MAHAGYRGVFIVLAFIVAAYVPFLRGGFLTDDFIHRARVEQVQSTFEARSQVRSGRLQPALYVLAPATKAG